MERIMSDKEEKIRDPFSLSSRDEDKLSSGETRSSSEHDAAEQFPSRQFITAAIITIVVIGLLIAIAMPNFMKVSDGAFNTAAKTGYGRYGGAVAIESGRDASSKMVDESYGGSNAAMSPADSIQDQSELPPRLKQYFGEGAGSEATPSPKPVSEASLDWMKPAYAQEMQAMLVYNAEIAFTAKEPAAAAKKTGRRQSKRQPSARNWRPSGDFWWSRVARTRCASRLR